MFGQVLRCASAEKSGLFCVLNVKNEIKQKIGVRIFAYINKKPYVCNIKKYRSGGNTINSASVL